MEAVVSEKNLLRSLPGQLIVEPDLEDMGEVEGKSDGGIVIPAQGKKPVQYEAIPVFAVVITSAIQGGPAPGDTVVFDRSSGMRFELEGIVYVSLYEENVRAWLSRS